MSSPDLSMWKSTVALASFPTTDKNNQTKPNRFDWIPPLSSNSLPLQLVAQRLKRLPTMRETWVQSLGWEDPLEKEMATHPSIPAWRVPWAEEPGGLQSTGSQRVGHD